MPQRSHGLENTLLLTATGVSHSIEPHTALDCGARCWLDTLYRPIVACDPTA